MTAGRQVDVALDARRLHLLDVLRASIEARSADGASSFIKRLLALPDRDMRSLVLTERLARLDLSLCLSILQTLMDRSLSRDPAAHEVLLDLTTARPLMQRLGYERARQLYVMARERERYALARMLLSPDAQMRLHKTPDPGWENKYMQDTSLGWRKALARGTDRQKLDRLRHDRNPTVVQYLLANPRITERDVVSIAAMRPANPECLAVVFAHPQWVRRYKVRVALALNPATPLDIALTLMPQLMLPDLEYAAASEKLEPAVRVAAREILARRQLRPDEEPGAEEDRDNPELEREVAELAAGLARWQANQA